MTKCNVNFHEHLLEQIEKCKAEKTYLVSNEWQNMRYETLIEIEQWLNSF